MRKKSMPLEKYSASLWLNTVLIITEKLSQDVHAKFVYHVCVFSGHSKTKNVFHRFFKASQ